MSENDSPRTELYDENPLARFNEKVDAVSYESLQAEKAARYENNEWIRRLRYVDTRLTQQ